VKDGAESNNLQLPFSCRRWGVFAAGRLQLGYNRTAYTAHYLPVLKKRPFRKCLIDSGLQESEKIVHRVQCPFHFAFV
jgi:hypothetical protein